MIFGNDLKTALQNGNFFRILFIKVKIYFFPLSQKIKISCQNFKPPTTLLAKNLNCVCKLNRYLLAAFFHHPCESLTDAFLRTSSGSDTSFPFQLLVGKKNFQM